MAVLGTTNVSTSTPWEKSRILIVFEAGAQLYGKGSDGIVSSVTIKPRTGEAIRQKARESPSTSLTPQILQSLSSDWIESSKQKTQIPSDLFEDAETVSGAASRSYTRGFDGTSPVSLQGLEPPYSRDLHDGKTSNGLKNEELDSSLSFASRNAPLHSQSATSPNNEITDTPSYTCELGTVLKPFLRAPHLTVRPYPPAQTSSNRYRPRSQSVPQMDQYMGGTCSSEALTSGFTAAKALDISSEEGSNAIQEMAYPIRAAFRMMRPPPSRAHTLPNEGCILAVVALKALESVSSFIERQPEGFLDYQENMVSGKVMEKVKRLSRADSINRDHVERRVAHIRI
ncbi:hypothetical protein LTR49_027413 [Elasticomyces elasticus]|nr:hypothetical protein LTR49_027413 [Elasticomyces elasticus]